MPWIIKPTFLLPSSSSFTFSRCAVDSSWIEWPCVARIKYSPLGLSLLALALASESEAEVCGSGREMRGSSGGSTEVKLWAGAGAAEFMDKDDDGAVRSVEAREEAMISIAAASGSFPFPCLSPVPEAVTEAAAAAAASRSLCNCFFVFPCVGFFLGLGGEGSYPQNSSNRFLGLVCTRWRMVDSSTPLSFGLASYTRFRAIMIGKSTRSKETRLQYPSEKRERSDARHRQV